MAILGEKGAGVFYSILGVICILAGLGMAVGALAAMIGGGAAAGSMNTSVNSQ